MKIVFVNRYFWPDQSATSQLLTDLANGLAARGYSIHVICSRQLYGDSRAELAPRDMAAGVAIHRVRTTRFGRGALLGRAIDYAAFYVASAFAMSRLVCPGDVLIAKTDPPLLSLLAAPISRLRRARLVNWQQDVFPEVATQLGANPLPRIVDRGLRRLRDWSLRAASMNVSIGSRMRDFLVARGIPSSKVCVIENWANDEAITSMPAAASELRRRLELLDRFVVGYSGNLGRAHEFDTLLACAHLLRDDPRFVFLMIGDGAKMMELKRAVAAGALENFRFLPYQPRASLGDSLAAADVHLVSLLPELEGLIVPSKLYGILAAARATVFVGDVDGEVARVLERSRCGLSVRVGDGDALAALLRRLESDREPLMAMGARARQALTAQFGFSCALDRWVSLLDGLSVGEASISATTRIRTNPRPTTDKP